MIDWPATLSLLAGGILTIGLLIAASLFVIGELRDSERNAARALAEGAAIRAQQAAHQQARWDGLCYRFGPENAANIWQRKVWIGQTEEMLRESLGPPADVSSEVLKTKAKIIYKYDQVGIGRYSTHVTVEDGIVVGWKM